MVTWPWKGQVERAEVELGFRGNRNQNWIPHHPFCPSLMSVSEGQPVLTGCTLTVRIAVHTTSSPSAHTHLPPEGKWAVSTSQMKGKRWTMVVYHIAFQNLFQIIHSSLKFQSRLEHKYLESELMTKFWKSWGFYLHFYSLLRDNNSEN